MSNIEVRTGSLSDISNRLENLKAWVSEIRSDFYNVASKMEWDIKAEDDINRVMSHINQELYTTEIILYNHIKFVNESIYLYDQADCDAKSTYELVDNLYSGVVNKDDVNINKGNFNSDRYSIKDNWSLFKEWLKDMVKNGYKNTGMNGGVLSVSWAISLMDLYFGYSGKNMDSFSMKAAFFNDTLKTGLGMFSDFYSNIVPEGIAESFSKVSTTGIGKFFKYGIPILNIGFGTLGQVFKSYNSLSSDGDMSCSDWGELLIDSSTKGMKEVLVAAATICGGPALGATVSFVDSKLELSKRAGEGYKLIAKEGLLKAVDGLLFEFTHPKAFIEGLIFKGDKYSDESLQAAYKWQNGKNIGEKLFNSFFDSGIGKLYKNAMCNILGYPAEAAYMKF